MISRKLGSKSQTHPEQIRVQLHSELIRFLSSRGPKRIAGKIAPKTIHAIAELSSHHGFETYPPQRPAIAEVRPNAEFTIGLAGTNAVVTKRLVPTREVAKDKLGLNEETLRMRRQRMK